MFSTLIIFVFSILAVGLSIWVINDLRKSKLGASDALAILGILISVIAIFTALPSTGVSPADPVPTIPPIETETSIPLIPTDTNSLSPSLEEILGKGYVNDFEFMPDSYNVSVATSQGLYLYQYNENSESFTELQFEQTLHPVQAINVSHQNQKVAAMLSDYVLVWDSFSDSFSNPQRIPNDITLDFDNLAAIFLSENGEYLFTSSDNNIEIWRTDTGEKVTSFAPRSVQSVNRISLIEGEADILIAVSSSWGNNRNIDIFRQLGVNEFDYLTTLTASERIIHTSFSTDGVFLAASLEDGKIEVWNSSFDSAPIVLEDADNLNRTYEITFSPTNSNVLYSVNSAGWIYSWDISTMNKLAMEDGHNGFANNITLSFDNKYVITSSWSDSFRLWEIEPNRFAHKSDLTTHSGPLREVIFTANGENLASISANSNLWIWDSNSYELVKTINHEAILYGLTNVENDIVLNGWSKVWYRNYNGQAWESNQVLEPNSDGLRSVAVSNNGNLLAAIQTRRIFLWDFDLNSSWTIRDFSLSREPQNNSPVFLDGEFSYDDNLFAAVSDDGFVSLWMLSDISSTNPVIVSNVGNCSNCESLGTVAFSPVENKLAVGSHDGQVTIWDVQYESNLPVLKNRTLRTIEQSSEVEDIAYSPDGTYIAVAYRDGLVRIWNTNQLADPLVLQGHRGAVTSVDFSPDGLRLASTSDDGVIIVWNLFD